MYRKWRSNGLRKRYFREHRYALASFIADLERESPQLGGAILEPHATMARALLGHASFAIAATAR